MDAARARTVRRRFCLCNAEVLGACNYEPSITLLRAAWLLRPLPVSPDAELGGHETERSEFLSGTRGFYPDEGWLFEEFCATNKLFIIFKRTSGL